MSLGSIFILTPTIGWATPLIWPVILTVAQPMVGVSMKMEPRLIF